MGIAKKMGLASESDLMRDIQNFGPMSNENIVELYGSIIHLFPKEHQEYLERMLSGKAELDPMLDLEMFLRLVNIYAINVVQWSIEEKKITKDIGSILGEVRQGAVAIENMRSKRNEVQVKIDESDSVVDPTRIPTLDFLKNIS